MQKILRLPMVAALAVLAGCAAYDTRLTSSTTQYLTPGGRVVERTSGGGIVDNISYWDGDGISGSPSITINLGEQKAYFYKDRQLVGVSLISSGREGYATPPGTYKVIQKSKDHVSNLYGDYVDGAGQVMVANVGVKRDPKPPGAVFRGAPMPYFLRFHGGYGLHAGFLPGFPASHGCVRMPERMAQIFFANSDHGTPVRVVN
jgi:hypothetical protein